MKPLMGSLPAFFFMNNCIQFPMIFDYFLEVFSLICILFLVIMKLFYIHMNLQKNAWEVPCFLHLSYIMLTACITIVHCQTCVLHIYVCMCVKQQY